MNKDSHQIFETYSQTSAQQEIVQEGLFDRLKARGAQAVGAVKGLGHQAAGGAQKLAGKAVGSVGGALGSKTAGTVGKEIQAAGGKKTSFGKAAAETAKYQSIVKSIVANAVNDLKKMNIPVKDEAALTKQLTAAVVSNLSQVTKTGQLRSSATGKIGAKVA